MRGRKKKKNYTPNASQREQALELADSSQAFIIKRECY